MQSPRNAGESQIPWTIRAAAISNVGKYGSGFQRVLIAPNPYLCRMG